MFQILDRAEKGFLTSDQLKELLANVVKPKKRPVLKRKSTKYLLSPGKKPRGKKVLESKDQNQPEREFTIGLSSATEAREGSQVDPKEHRKRVEVDAMLKNMES